MKAVELGFQHLCSTVSDEGKGMSLPSWGMRWSASARHNVKQLAHQKNELYFI